MKSHKIITSIVVGTMNRGIALQRFLDSIKEVGILNRSDIEVIIVDNNQEQSKILSTTKLCEEYGAKCFHESIPGKPYAVNKGIINSQGKYIAFTDDDVVIKNPKWIEVMIKEFELNPNLGYVSGNVIAMKQNSESEKTWEKKGGLSKGQAKKYWSKKYLSSWPHQIKPWQFNKMCAGANCMIPKTVIDKVGPLNILLESGRIGHGTTLEIGYRIAKFGYELLYTPESEVYHSHPETNDGLIKKMYTYGVGDTAYHMCIFLEHKDFRNLWWSVIGHSLYTIKNKVLKRILGSYPFPMPYILAGLKGNLAGPYLFLYDYYLNDGKKRKLEYQEIFSMRK